MSLFLILGTRPQIIKSVPLLYSALKKKVDIQIIHTGQHYDYTLSEVFFKELTSVKPVINLHVGSGSHIFQIAQIMSRIEKHLVEANPSLVIVPGDTNSALAGALASIKLGVPVVHLESGARSYDMNMAEEINRRLIDHCAKILFAPTSNCVRNLEQESVTGEIFQVGDTMYDLFLRFEGEADKCDIVKQLDLIDKEFILFTTHRAENVDDPIKLKNMILAVQNFGMDVIFPIHPRTNNKLKENNILIKGDRIQTINPTSYIEMLKLLKHAKIVITDSGGLQKEAFWSKIPCITTREQIEWIETIEMGVNIMTGANPVKIIHALKHVEEHYSEIKKRFTTNPFGDGKASEKIIRILKNYLS